MSRLKKARVIGSGPNGLAAAIVLAREGVDVTVYEARETPGGGCSSAELTLPGFTHDVCSAVHPMAAGSPVFASMPLEKHGLRWVQPAAALAHPLDGGRAAVLENSFDDAVSRLGADGPAYRRAAGPLADRWPELLRDVLAPLRWPAHPLLYARFGALAGLPASWEARALFKTEEARALFAGMAAHSILPLDKVGSSAIAWALGLSAHSAGWPVAEGGSQRITDALVSYLRSLGGKLELGREVRSFSELDQCDAVLCDVTPRQLLALAGERLPAGYARSLRAWRYGPGVFKLDWALSGPIPWEARECARAATVHLGGTLEELEASERAAWEGRISERPFVLLAQQTLFDPTRAPAGKHTAWAYCHVPHGSAEDMTARIEAQVERFAPGFSKLILARRARGPAELERRNANLVGGDIAGGAQDLPQLLLRPTRRFYRTGVRGLYLCSSSTPPGAGVHGMCGYWAARAALADFG